jgi:hypothetical protein
MKDSLLPVVLRPNADHGLLIHDTPHSVGLLWTSDQLVAETSTWQNTTLTTDIHASGGIQTHNISRRAAANLRLRPRSYRDRLMKVFESDERLCRLCIAWRPTSFVLLYGWWQVFSFMSSGSLLDNREVMRALFYFIPLVGYNNNNRLFIFDWNWVDTRWQ